MRLVSKGADDAHHTLSHTLESVMRVVSDIPAGLVLLDLCCRFRLVDSGLALEVGSV
ncbi:hypothetical protein T484DRAFT_1923064 [Baffinella frigidus]|nr:hypothetical protein T484DRAFT_1923064 [Cryptophyta sp. CCMP2293]